MALFCGLEWESCWKHLCDIKCQNETESKTKQQNMPGIGRHSNICSKHDKLRFPDKANIALNLKFLFLTNWIKASILSNSEKSPLSRCCFSLKSCFISSLFWSILGEAFWLVPYMLTWFSFFHHFPPLSLSPAPTYSQMHA